MAWTTPKTWAFQEGVESSELNIHLRDNLNSLGPITKKLKASDTSRATVTLSDDPDLTLPVAANETWLVDLTLMIDSNQTADFKMGWSVPSGTTMRWAPLMGDSANLTWRWVSAVATPTTAALVDQLGTLVVPSTIAGTVWGVMVRAVVAVSSTAGTVGFQWAQNSLSGTTILKATSLLIAHRFSP